jgi:peptidoglycan/xylan/chitin deacetylase (PgdA/CDA1 family)
MLKALKGTVLQTIKGAGAFGLMAQSRWRQQRLLILCYHGISIKDEHEWRGGLYITPSMFRRRLEILAKQKYSALSLNEAVLRLREGSLPHKSVAITFDDGFYDFYLHAFPALKEFGFPATVYQTTYYCDHPYPVFNLALSYLFWRARSQRLDGSAWGVSGIFDLAAQDGREAAAQAFLEFASRQNFSAAEKDKLASRLASQLGIDYAEILELRILQLMSPGEISAIVAGGIDVQLHTHRHRTPMDEALFTREIRDNRAWLAPHLANVPNHFCYPSGVYRKEFLPWLRAENVISGTTCDHGLAERATDPLMLPRFLDSMGCSEVSFESWLCGASSFLERRRR